MTVKTTGDATLVGNAEALVLGYLNRAVALQARGYASTAHIDLAMRLGCGLPAGPFRLLDEWGLDVARDRLTDLHRRTGDPGLRPAPLLGELIAAGRLGRSAGHGFFRYDQPEALSDRPGDAAAFAGRPVHRVGLLGSGTMACGIAEVTTRSGYPTVLVARSPGRAGEAEDRITRSLDRAVGRGRLTAEQAHDTTVRLSSGSDRAAFADCDLVVEAVVEDLPTKREAFAELDRICRPGAVLATATSSLPVTACAAATGRPADVVGLHFFNPAPVMRLVELVCNPATTDEVAATVAAFCGRLGKSPVVCDDAPGFIVNYLLFPYLNAAIRMLEREGGTAKAIDDAVTGRFGFPMGPFALLDTVGLDVSLAIQRSLDRSYPDQGLSPAPMLTSLVAAGRLGRKSGGGFRADG